MTGWLDTLFGNLPPQPKRPAPREAMLGMGGYQDMPTSPNIDDRRAQGPDYAAGIKGAPGAWTENYWPSAIKGGKDPFGGGQFPQGYDPLVAAPLIATGRNVRDAPPATGAYAPSYRQTMPPPRQAAPPPFNIPLPSYGPSGLPYIGAHLPISPGDPGWTPPSSSPPASSQPMGAASQPSFQQLIDFLQSRGGVS